MRQPLVTPSGIERDLIDAAIAVNAASTLDDAFRVLADTALVLSGADAITIASWNADRRFGVVRAAVGEAVEHHGLRIPADAHTADVLDGQPYIGSPDLEHALEKMCPYLLEMHSIVRVGFVASAFCVTFQASFRGERADDELEPVASVLGTLVRLTTLAERVERERESARLDSVVEATTDGVILAIDGRAIPNDAARTLLAIPVGEEVGATSRFDPRTLSGEPYETDAGAPGALIRESGRFRLRATALDGRGLVLDGSVSPLDDGAVIVFRDVTAEYEREFLTEQYLRALFDTIPTAISVVDPTTFEMLSANRRFLSLVGYELDDVIGQVPPFPWWDGKETLVQADSARFARIFRHSSGRPVPVEIETHPIVGADGNVVARLGLVTDLSERQRFEQQIVQGGKLAAIGELAAGVAHEINNPLFAILGLTEFLLKESEPGSKAHSRLELIQQTGIEIKEIVCALLDFARENAEERHLVVLEEVVRSTVDLVELTNAHKGVELTAHYDGSLAPVLASPNQLKQIFLNLIGNARQAMPGGGKVRIDVRAEGDVVLATVSDDGPGLDPEVVHKVFDPFFTTKRSQSTGGTGLGLSVCLGIAESHGGSLTVSSEPGKGAAFTLQLPRAHEGAHG